MEEVSNSGDFHMHRLPDDSLRSILRHLVPPPGLIAQPAAVRARQAYLRHFHAPRYHVHQERKSLLGGQDCQDAWRACLADLPSEAASATEHLLEHPPWQRGPAGDRLYAAAAGLPALLVCKRWRDLLLNGSILKIAMCSVGVVPPASAEILILASPEVWQAAKKKGKSGCGSVAITYLHRLFNLKSLVFFSMLDPERLQTTTGSLPALPSGLHNLRHLLYVNLTPTFSSCKKTHFKAAALASIASYTKLATLGLAVELVPNSGESDVITALAHLSGSLPRLSTLCACDLVDTRNACAALTALRILCVSVDWPQLKVTDTCDVSPLSSLAALESLRLDGSRNHHKRRRVTGIGALVQLQSLAIDHYRGKDVAADAAALPALTTLRIKSVWASDASMVQALQAVASGLPPLALSLAGADDCLQCLRQLTSLVELFFLTGCEPRIEAVSKLTNFAALGALTQLTFLGLSQRMLVDVDCSTLGRLSQLEKLILDFCTVPQPAGLRSLRALTELRMRGCCEGDPVVWLASLLLASSYPHLRILQLDIPDPWSAARMNQLTGLSDLEELDLSENALTAESLARLVAMPQLRALRIDQCGGFTAAALGPFVAHGTLQCVFAELAGIYEDSEEVQALVARGALVLCDRRCDEMPSSMVQEVMGRSWYGYS